MSTALEPGPRSTSVSALMPCQVAAEDSDGGGGSEEGQRGLGSGNTTG